MRCRTNFDKCFCGLYAQIRKEYRTKEALKQLGLDNASYPVPKPQTTSSASLQASYNGALNIAVAARELQLSFHEKQCELTLQYIQTIAAAKNITLQRQVDAQDVTERKG